MIHIQALPGRQTTTFEIENTMAKFLENIHNPFRKQDFRYCLLFFI